MADNLIPKINPLPPSGPVDDTFLFLTEKSNTKYKSTLSDLAISYSAITNMPMDLYISGGTYNAGNIYFSGHGINFVVDVSALLDDTNTYTTGGTLNGTDLVYTRNDSVSYTVDLSSLIDDTNFYTTGGTYSGGYIYFSGIGTNYIVDVNALLDDTNTFTTGSTLNGDILTLKRNDGVEYTTDLSKFNYDSHTGDTTIHFTKSSINLSDLGSSAHTHTISEVTDYFDIYTSGGTYSNGYINFSGHGINFSVDVNALLDDTNTYTTGTTLSGNTLILERNDGVNYTADLSTFDFNPTSIILQGKIDSHTGDTSNPHQTSFSNLTSSGHTHLLSEITDYVIPFDNYLTGGTYNTGNIYFSGHGNNFIVDVSALLDDTNTYTTGATLTNDILTLKRNDGVEYTADLSKFNYDSHTGDTTIHFTKSSINLSDLGSSAHTHTISEITDYTLPFDTYTSGGTYSSGNLYFSGHGINYIVDVSALLDDTNTYTTGGTLNGSILTYTRNDSVDYSVDLNTLITTSLPYSAITNTPMDLYISAGTYSAGYIYFSGQGINFVVDVSPLIDDTNTFTTGSTLINDVLTLTRNDGFEYTTDLSKFNYDSHTGDTTIHFTKGSINLSDLGSSAHTHTISEISNYTVPYDTFTSGGTYSSGNIYFSGHGTNYIVDVSALLDDTNTYTTGATLTNDVLYLTRNDGFTYNSNLSKFNYNSHTGDTTIHYTKSSINLSDLGSSAHTHPSYEAMDTTLNGKIDSHTGRTNNPHSTTLSNLVSSAHTHTISEISNYVVPFDTYTTGSTLSGNTIILTRNDGGKIYQDLTTLGAGLIVPGTGVNSLKQYGTSSINQATGLRSSAFGWESIASGDYSHTCNSGLASGILSCATGEITRASGYASSTFGSGTVASGITSHAEGLRSVAGGDQSHAEGLDTKALGDQSHAEGHGLYVTGQAAHGEGYMSGVGSIVSGQYSHHEGANNKVTGYASHASGSANMVAGSCGYAEGYQTISSADRAHSEGEYTRASGFASHAEGKGVAGQYTTASGDTSHAEGLQTVAGGNYSHAEGSQTRAYGETSHAEGQLGVANGGYGSHAEGYNTRASGSASHAEGDANISSGSGAHSEGYHTQATANYAHSEGLWTIASGLNSHSEGSYTIASGLNSHAEGYGLSSQYNAASGSSAHVEGYLNVAGGNYSHAEGAQTRAYGETSHAEGNLSRAIGIYGAHAEGYDTRAIGNAAHAEGNSCQATAVGAHAEGYFTTATAQYAHAEGYSCDATADSAHAEGRDSQATNIYAHAEGQTTQATGYGSHAEGYGTIASGHYSHARGLSSVSYLYGMTSQSSWGGTKRKQYGSVTMACTTTGLAAVEMFLDSATGRIVLTNDTAYNFRIICIGTDASLNSASYVANGTIRNVAGAVTLLNSTVTEQYDGITVVGLAVAADDTNNALALTCAGKAATNIEWVAYVDWVETAKA